MKPIYFVAKYVRDVMRMEPVNIGVILWNGGQVFCRFRGASINENGKIECDGRALRWVGNPGNYQQWIEYWVGKIRSIPSNAEDDAVTAILTSTNKRAGNYWLIEGGFLLDDADDVESAGEHLYGLLVDDRKESKETVIVSQTEKFNFDTCCKELLRRSGWAESKGFYSDREIVCDLGNNVPLSLNVSYALYNGKLRSIIQEVSATPRESNFEMRVHDTAFKIEKIRSGQGIEKSDALIFFRNRDEYESSQKSRELLKLMEYVGNAVDIAQPERALEELSRTRKLVC